MLSFKLETYGRNIRLTGNVIAIIAHYRIHLHTNAFHFLNVLIFIAINTP